MRALLRWPPRFAAGRRHDDGGPFVRGNRAAPRSPGSGVVADGGVKRPAVKRPAPIRILLADHDPSSIDLTRDALARSGVHHTLKIARDRRAVLDLLVPGGSDAPPFLPDLILLALDLTAGNTLEIYRAIRASTRSSEVPLVLLTASTRQADLRRKCRVADHTYVRTPEGLRATIEELGSHWATFALLPPIA